MSKTICICASALLGLFLAGCGNSSGISGSSGKSPDGAGSGSLGSAPVSEKSACELAPYPSLQWTQCETQNLAVGMEYGAVGLSLAPATAAATLAYQQDRLATLLADPERQPNPNVATAGVCPVDPRLVNWPAAGGIVEPVLFTSRSGGTLSGHVWATRSGPAKRPGVLIINGSIIACDQVYWYAAQALAKAGFVVLTFDVQGEGMSDQFGEAPDQREDAFAGTPALGLVGPTPASGVGLGGNGLPFYDGGTDALDFFLSTPSHVYVPRPSRSSGTSHAPKQERRVAAGLNAAFNPLWEMLDANTIGVAGHSYGAMAASGLGQSDPRLSAVVAWDNLCVPVSPSPDEFIAFTTAPVNKTVGGVFYLYGFSPDCFGAPAGPAPALSKPALGITADYIAPTPYLAPPDPLDKQQASRGYSAAGVDTGSIVVRGGTHTDFNDGAGFTPASLRGIDMTTWYTVAWFAKYLQHDPNADRMLLSARWRNDAATAAADPGGDANLISHRYASRLDITLAGGHRYDCENLRNGCAGQFKATEDCGPAEYSFAAIANAPGVAAPAVCAAAR